MDNIPEHIHAFPRVNHNVVLPVAVAAWDDENGVLYIGNGETKGGVPFKSSFDEERRKIVTRLDGENQIHITSDVIPVVIKTHLNTFYSIRGEDLSLSSDETKIIIDITNVLAVNNIESFQKEWTVYFAKGEFGEKGEQGIPGKDGADGEDGHTPEITIGENGNWIIDGEDTGKPSKGMDGKNGETTVVTIGDNGNWIIDGKDTGKPSKGTDGKKGEATVITVGDNGNWFLDGEDTNTKAQGDRGVSIDVNVFGKFEDITNYNEEPKDFIYFATDTGNIYIKISDESGDWSEPFSLKGDKGDKGEATVITVGDNGNWFLDGEDTNTKAQGDKGEATVVTIGDNGNWFLDGKDTNSKAQGDKGEATVVTIGDNGNWFLDGKDTNTKAQGDKGEATVITVGENGNWFLDGKDTNTKAQGDKGDKGEATVVTIGDNGNWIIDGEDTNTKAQGDKGDKGEATVITIGDNGNWFLDGVDTGKKATGSGSNAVLSPTPPADSYEGMIWIQVESEDDVAYVNFEAIDVVIGETLPDDAKDGTIFIQG